MQAFAALVTQLGYTRSRNAKVALIADYLRATPDPDRGWALAALTGEADFAAVKSSAVRSMAMERVDPELFRLSRDFVGDTAETVALIWPERLPPANDLRLADAVDALASVTRARAPQLLMEMMDRLDSAGRYALIKLATGAMRVGISARLAKTAFAQAFGLDVDAVEEVWHALSPPYASLFAWGDGGARPDIAGTPYFRPFMLAHPLEDGTVDLADYAAEWKWDGIRIQIVRIGNEVRLFSRGGDDITPAFPDVAAAVTVPGVFDGELLVRGAAQMGEAASFNALQQRLGRKSVSAKMLAEAPAFVRLYDLLIDDGEDLRALPWHQRRARLETRMAALPADRFDLSQIIEAPDFAALGRIRDGARDAAIEGVMLKRLDSAYVPGRRVGLWYKWKRDPLSADCVMMYAQRGSGKRSSFYSDYTFGCWTEDGELVPVGKAYSGFSDAELKWLDKFVRQNTVGRFGPVREVAKSLVLEVAFDSIHVSKRHKSGVAMRFPRIARLRRDKPAEEADTVAALKKLIT
ncbi:cisplatin damage response ATP-dependent DNA ligase [Blastomonas sp.]|uniref:cisplatin damage response ATP-dependent DNA ligase n=1 Tax=Blastomonas sp. TaxID=1909299 RepID=UPI003592FBBC